MIDFPPPLGKVMHGYPALTVERLLRFVDAHGIEKSVILPLVAPEDDDCYYTKEQAPEDFARHTEITIKKTSPCWIDRKVVPAADQAFPRGSRAHHGC